MFSHSYCERSRQLADGQAHLGHFVHGETLQSPVAALPPDMHTPASEQFDDITYPGSEVTVIHRIPGRALPTYWHQNQSGVRLNGDAGRIPIENESSSATLSCADSYQAQQNGQENKKIICGKWSQALSTFDGEETTTIGANSQKSLSLRPEYKQSSGRKLQLSEGENDRYKPKSHRERARKSSAHCVSEGEICGNGCGTRKEKNKKHRWRRRRSPSCSCDFSHHRGCRFFLGQGLANSLPTVKKHWCCDHTSSPKLRRRRPIAGMFGANLSASQAEDQWSDSEQIRLRPILPSYCGLVGLSLLCLLALGCLMSPIFMLLVPIALVMDKSMPQRSSFYSSLHIPRSCNLRCEADCLSIAVKTLLLALTTWKLYIQPIARVCRRLRIRPVSVSALLKRKVRTTDCVGVDLFPIDPKHLHPSPSTARLIGLTLSMNFLSVGATCAFWVAFVARWMKWLLEASPEHLSPVTQDLQVQLSLPIAVPPPSELSSQIDHLNTSYSSLVSFVLTFTDTLLLLHIVNVLLRILNFNKDNVRHYIIQVVRSPDGVSKTYRIAGSSLEIIATHIIQQYNMDFPLYDAQVASAPYRYLRIVPDSQSKDSSKVRFHSTSLRLRQQRASFSCLTQEEQEYQMKRCSSAGGGSSFKFYSLDGPEISSTAAESMTTLKDVPDDVGDGGRNVSTLCSDRYHSEMEFERLMQKRRMRLLIATEKMFTGVKTISTNVISLPGYSEPISPRQAAQIIFPQIIVPLQKYLRLTRLQHLHPPDAILSRLATCLAHSASPEAFLAIYRPIEPSSNIVFDFIPPKQPANQTKFLTSKTCCGASLFETTQLAQSWHLHVLDSEAKSPTLIPKPGTRFYLSRAGVQLFCQIQFEPQLRIKRAKRSRLFIQQSKLLMH